MQNSVSGFWSQMMGRWGKSAVLAIAGASVLASSASAGTVSYSASKELDFTDWTTTLSVRQFDGSLGTLTKVVVTINGSNQTQTKIENRGRRAVNFVTTSDVTLAAQCDGLTLASVVPRVVFANSLAAYDGVSDFLGASAAVNPPLLSSLSSTSELVVGVDDVTCFLGNGFTPFQASAVASGFVSGSADYDFEVETLAAVELVVTYEYDETVTAVLGAIGDRVWKDSNSDGVQDANEPGLKGWTVTLLEDDVVIGSQQTGDDGLYLFTDLPSGTYTVRVTPKGGYTQTYDLDGLLTAHVATAVLGEGETRLDVDFGYDCFSARIRTGTGCTPGFWSNKNGQALIRPSDLAVLTALKLVDNSGNDVDMMDPTTFNFGGSGPASLAEGKSVLKDLLLNNNAVNMAAQLSRHLAAFQLNVRWGFISGGKTFKLNGSTVTAQELIVLANATLNEAPYTPSGHPLRSYQSAIKDILDAANNAARR